MEKLAKRSTDWIATLTFVLGAAVVVPSLIALAISLVAVALKAF